MIKNNKILFIALYSDELGKSAYGSVQRTENIIQSVSLQWSCDVALITRVVNQTQHYEESGDDGGVVLINGEDDPPKLPYIFEKILPLIPNKFAGLLFRKHYVFNPFPFSSQANGELKKLLDSNKYDVIISRYFWPLFYTGIPKIISSKQKLIVDVDDDPCELFLTKYNEEKSHLSIKDKLFRLVNYINIRRVTLNYAKFSDVLWFVKKRDAIRFKKLNTTSVILSNIPQWSHVDCSNINQLTSSRVALFVGKLDYLPNKQGLYKFLKESWRKIKEQVPAATLLVVGKGLDAKDQDVLKSYSNVQYLGFVVDLNAVYKQCRFTIAPIYQGGGSKIKILESNAYGRACVTTKHGYSGVSEHFKNGKSILVGETAEDLIRACVDLYLDDPLVVSIAQAGHEVVRSCYNTKIFDDAIYNSICSIITE